MKIIHVNPKVIKFNGRYVRIDDADLVERIINNDYDESEIMEKGDFNVAPTKCPCGLNHWKH